MQPEGLLWFNRENTMRELTFGSPTGRTNFGFCVPDLVRPLAFIAAALFACAGPALAGNPAVFFDITALPDKVSFSRPVAPATEALNTASAFRIQVINNSTNVLNDVRVHGEADFVNGVRPLPAVPVNTIGMSCTFGTLFKPVTSRTVTTVDCLIGQLRGGGDGRTFVVIFQTPYAPATVSPSTDLIDFTATASYGEGPNDAGGAAHVDFKNASAQTALGTVTNTSVNTFAFGDGQIFYTGGKQHATADDPFVTLFQVPLTASVTVNEVDTLQSCLSVVSCWRVAMSVTDLGGAKAYFPGCTYEEPNKCLRVTLLRDESTITGGNIDRLIVKYSPSAYTSVNSDEIELAACSATWQPMVDRPCIWKRTAFPKQTVDPLDSKDWKIEILATDNGSWQE